MAFWRKTEEEAFFVSLFFGEFTSSANDYGATDFSYESHTLTVKLAARAAFSGGFAVCESSAQHFANVCAHDSFSADFCDIAIISAPVVRKGIMFADSSRKDSGLHFFVEICFRNFFTFMVFFHRNCGNSRKFQPISWWIRISSTSEHFLTLFYYARLKFNDFWLFLRDFWKLRKMYESQKFARSFRFYSEKRVFSQILCSQPAQLQALGNLAGICQWNMFQESKLPSCFRFEAYFFSKNLCFSQKIL